MTRKGRFLPDSVIPFQVFLQRAKTISLFRKFIRGTNFVSNQELKLDIHKQIRDNFRNNSQVTDPVVIRHLFQDANRQLKMLEALGQEKSKSKSTNNKNNNNNNNNITSNDIIVGKGWPWSR